MLHPRPHSQSQGEDHTSPLDLVKTYNKHGSIHNMKNPRMTEPQWLRGQMTELHRRPKKKKKQARTLVSSHTKKPMLAMTDITLSVRFYFNYKISRTLQYMDDVNRHKDQNDTHFPVSIKQKMA